MTAALAFASSRPHRHDGQACLARHLIARRPDGTTTRITTHDPVARLPKGWVLTGESWA